MMEFSNIYSRDFELNRTCPTIAKRDVKGERSPTKTLFSVHPPQPKPST